MNVDIAQMYVGMQQAAVQNEASMAVLSKSLDVAEAQGDQMVGLLASAGSAATSATDAQIAQGLAITDPALGGAIDLSV
jgi:hypothetical protein